jgi:tetratricopeptide (TPR) repeat protein
MTHRYRESRNVPEHRRNDMKTISMIVAAIAMPALLGGATLAQNGNDLFQQGLVKERTQGDYAGAVKIYQTIVQKFSGDRKLVARALYQIGQAYEKLGNSEARKAYERIARDFNDQKDIVADANRRLTAMNLPRCPCSLRT